MNESKINHLEVVSSGPALSTYVRANFFAWAFVAVLAVGSFFICGGVWDDVTSGVVEFIFFVLGGGFTLVSFLDFFYEKYNGSESLGDPKP
ncbi:MAG: hypothetical protein ACREL1_01845 [bacterium]